MTILRITKPNEASVRVERRAGNSRENTRLPVEHGRRIVVHTTQRKGLMKRPAAKSLWVVIPAYNEQDWIETTLDALATQSDRDFHLLVVENGSTDHTGEVVRRWFLDHPDVRGEVLVESEKGTGVAADTGFRYAIDHGADWVARTDADCLPAEDWVERIRARSGTIRMIVGRSVARSDDFPISRLKQGFLRVVVALAGLVGKVLPSNRGAGYKRSFVMCAGRNLAIEAVLYCEAGGFPRSRIEEIHEDRELANRVRAITPEFVYCREIVVAASTRRLQHQGLVRTLLWYWDHRYRPSEIDIR